jgi:hypothetical protein
MIAFKPARKSWSTLLKVICSWNHYDAKRILKKKLERNLHEKNNNDTISSYTAMIYLFFKSLAQYSGLAHQTQQCSARRIL